MIHNIVKLLQSQDFYSGDPIIEEAKGRNAIPKNLKEWLTLLKRSIISIKLSNGRLQ
jgi:hypothetical protein